MSATFALTNGRRIGGCLGAVLRTSLFELALIDAINRCCDARGDDDRNREALIAEAASLTARNQADMREHFEQEAATWAAANWRGVAR